MRRVVCACIATAAALAVTAAPASAIPAVGVTPAGDLVRYDTDAPGTILERHTITGLQSGEKVMGIDVRPATGQLYALGIVRGAQDTGRIYVIDPGTGAATEIGTDPFRTDLTVSEYGMDFNPAADRLRIVNRGDNNVRVNPDNGALSGTDSNLNPASDVDAIAYDQNNVGTPQTTLWGYDSGADTVVRIGGVNGGPPDGSPNAGMVVSPFTGGSGINNTGRAEMDFAPGGNGFLTAQTAGTTYSLYKMNMNAGTVTLVGNFAEAIEDLALLKPSSFDFADRDVTVSENSGTASVTVERTGNTSGTQTLAYTTADGTATSADYTATSGTLTFGPTETSKTFTVPITNDTAQEPAETVALSLSSPTGGAGLGAAVAGTITILDDDGPADTTKPQLLLAVPSVIKASKLLRRLAGAFSCSEMCNASFTLKLGKSTIGKASKRLLGAGKASFRLQLSKSGKKTLRKQLVKHRTVRVVVGVTGTDAAGNRGTARATVSVSR